VRLLLDEQYSPEIAKELRRQGHAVEAVAERPDLQASDDEALLVLATREGRTLVTNNVRDFVPIARSFAAEGRGHSGLIFTSDRSLPRTRRGFGVLARALQRALEAHPDDDALVDQSMWLEPSHGA